ncbi:MAG: pyrroline-5-carboxylate reductase [Bacillales bacterium]|jgi:pyrroline-5-carboxylate reductase|nr:pyrroline-5-carboxylate reductase [Bacillales bacterium]
MKIGFIGTGNMGMAIIKGYLAADKSLAENIYATDLNFEQLKNNASDLGIQLCQTNTEVVTNSDVVVLAVKPNVYEQVLTEIKHLVSENHILVSIAAGITIAQIEQTLHKSVKVVRTMPNTPAMVNEGITALSRNNQVSDGEFEFVMQIFRSIGKAEAIDEKLMDVIPGVSGSSPAYVYMFIEALADGAVLHGMPREQAYRFAAQAVLGSAKMVIDSGLHPGTLKDMVCTPGGATIEAVKSLESNRFRFAVMEAVDVCSQKAKRMSQ